MALSISNKAKTNISITNRDKAISDITIDEAIGTIDNAAGTIDSPRTTLVKRNKNDITITNKSKP